MVEKIAGSDSEETESDPHRRLISGETKESDHNNFSEDNISDISDADTVIIERDENIFGEVIFKKEDIYGPLFCKVAAVPQFQLRMNKEILSAIHKAISKLSKEYISDPCEEKFFNILIFWKLVKGSKKKSSSKQIIENIIKLGNGLAKEMIEERIQGVKFHEKLREEGIIVGEQHNDFLSDKEIAQVVKLIEKGQMRKAALRVEKQTNGVAELTQNVIRKLEELHPIGKDDPFRGWAGSQKLITGDGELLQGMVKDLDSQTTAGIDGWTPALIQLCYGEIGDNDNEKMDFRNFLTMYFLSMAEGTAPGSQMLNTARLTPLIKPLGGGIRPIACGPLFYRLGMRYCVAILQRRQEQEPLLTTQFGVGSKGGIEVPVQLVQQYVDKTTEDNKLYMAELDGRNGYNELKRPHMATQIRKHAPELYKLAKWAYNNPAALIVGSGNMITAIAGTEGVRQGGPESGLLYSIGVRSVMEEMGIYVGDDAVIFSYLDNLYVISKKITVLDEAIFSCKSIENETGYFINEAKCKIHDLWEVNQGRACIEMLGACIGPTELRKQFVEDSIENVKKILGRLKQLPKQHALLMLRQSTSNKLRFLMRAMELHDIQDQVRKIDDMFYGVMDFLRCVPDGERTEMETNIMGLPGNMGGLGIYSHSELSSLARRASVSTSRNELIQRELSTKQLLVHLAELKQKEGIQEDANTYRQMGPIPTVDDEQRQTVTQKQLTHEWMEKKRESMWDKMTREQQTIFCDNKAGIGVLDIIPKGIYRGLTDAQVAANLNIFCLRPKHTGNLCQCGEPNSIAHYEVCRACDNVAKMTSYRHNAIRDTIMNKINKTSVNLKCSKEPMVFGNQPNNNNQSRADLQISAKEGMPQNHEYHGLFDLMTKVASSKHTQAKRDKAMTDAVEGGEREQQKIRRKEVQAALQIGVDFKVNKYAAATAAGIKMTPLLITTAGTMHKTMYKAMKKFFPDGNQRRWVLMDIAIFLARGRGQVYARDLGILEMAAAAEDADVGA